MKKWTLVRAVYSDGKVFTPKKSDVFTINFTQDNKFAVTTDCNSMGGGYASTGDTLVLSDIFSTKMFCEGSEELVFSDLLGKVDSYNFTSKGELVMDLKMDGGSVVFK